VSTTQRDRNGTQLDDFCRRGSIVSCSVRSNRIYAVLEFGAGLRPRRRADRRSPRPTEKPTICSRMRETCGQPAAGSGDPRRASDQSGSASRLRHLVPLRGPVCKQTRLPLRMEINQGHPAYDVYQPGPPRHPSRVNKPVPPAIETKQGYSSVRRNIVSLSISIP